MTRINVVRLIVAEEEINKYKKNNNNNALELFEWLTRIHTLQTLNGEKNLFIVGDQITGELFMDEFMWII